jgi:hypothetical protein
LPNLKEELPIQVQKASIPNNLDPSLDPSRTSPWNIIMNTASTENKERKDTEGCKKEKNK